MASSSRFTNEKLPAPDGDNGRGKAPKAEGGSWLLGAKEGDDSIVASVLSVLIDRDLAREGDSSRAGLDIDEATQPIPFCPPWYPRVVVKVLGGVQLGGASGLTVFLHPRQNHRHSPPSSSSVSIATGIRSGGGGMNSCLACLVSGSSKAMSSVTHRSRWVLGPLSPDRGSSER